MLIYILIRCKLIRYMLTKYIIINIDTIRVIFYIWQRNNLLPFFYVECCGGMWEGVECEKWRIWEQFYPPFVK